MISLLVQPTGSYYMHSSYHVYSYTQGLYVHLPIMIVTFLRVIEGWMKFIWSIFGIANPFLPYSIMIMRKKNKTWSDICIWQNVSKGKLLWFSQFFTWPQIFSHNFANYGLVNQQYKSTELLQWKLYRK